MPSYDAARDYYAALQVADTATVQEIKTAWRAKMQQVHPDRHGNAEDATSAAQSMNEAYRVLSDPSRRAAYDRLRHQHWSRVAAEFLRRPEGSSPRAAPRRRKKVPTVRQASQSGVAPTTARSPFTALGFAVARAVAKEHPFWAALLALGGAAMDEYLKEGRR